MIRSTCRHTARPKPPLGLMVRLIPLPDAPRVPGLEVPGLCPGTQSYEGR